MAVVSMVTCTAVFSQGSTTSALSGTVLDSKGEVLIGATVKALHQPSGSMYGNASNVEGKYRIANMRVGGPYTITVTYVGYSGYSRDGIYLTLGQTLEFNAVLSEDELVLEGIEIVADRDAIIDGNVTGAVTKISKDNINTLPTVGRDLSDFTRLTPQAFVDNGDDDGPAISIAGQSNRYNAIFIDGAVNNDVFGLSAQGTNGGQTGVNPISLDAIEQIQVNVAPFDVTQGGFTGGGINAVTRSGTNTVEGSAYYFLRNESLAGQTPPTLTDDPTDLPEFTAETYGFRVGGPIIKDKLFYFANVEIQDNVTPQPFDIRTIDNPDTPQDEAALAQEDIDDIRNFLSNNFGYETGGFNDNQGTLESTKIIAKIDWNINENHKLSFRHSYVDAENTDGFVSNINTIQFENNSEVFPSTTNSSALELKSNFGNNFSNSLILGYTTVEDDRGFAGSPFPDVTVEGGDVNYRFGSEPFSTANILEQDVFTITNNFNWFKGNHTVTIGTHNEFYSFTNLFIAQNFGAYRYESVDDLLNQAEPLSYVRSFSLGDGIDGDASGAAAEFNAYQLGFYIQDEFQVNDKLKLTGGLRFDIPVITTDPAFADDVFETTLPRVAELHDLNGAEPGQVPDAQLYFAPRFGFNWDVNGDLTTQVRGGLGVFTGRVPFVWAGGPFNNNGTNVGRIELDIDDDPVVLANGDPVPLRSGTNTIQPAEVGLDPDNQIPNGRLEIFDNDFRYPQVFRATLAIDKKLPLGLVGTLEGMYTKNINNINHRNVNRNPLSNYQLAGGQDERLMEQGDRIDSRYTDIILVENTNKGYSYNLTAQIQKPFDNGLTASLAYTFGESFGINDGTSSQLTSNWGRIEHAGSGLDNLPLSRSDFDPGHRFNAFVSYSKDYKDFFGTTVSFFLNAQSGRPFSYVIDQSRGIFDEGTRDNALVYVPESIDDINLVDWDNRGTIVSAEEQWIALDKYIDSDPYLSTIRGQYAERNGARAPFETTIDFKIIQNFYLKTGENKNTLQLSLDIFNFTNFLNEDWGKVYSVGGSRDLYRLVNGGSLGSGVAPEYQYRLGDNADEFFDSRVRDTGINSGRWQMQFGVRYIFN
ncbi:MAG: carboxypeptidase regulatory-like domain-containing protein [Bacteroidota bacterium]